MAVWSPSTDHAVVLGFTALLAATLLSPVACAPVQKSNTTSVDHWWYHPCTGAPGKLRHSRSADHLLKQVFYQLKTFIGRLAHNIESIQDIYKPVKPTSPAMKAPWLKIEKMLSELKKGSRKSATAADETLVLRRLQTVHGHLEFFAGALEVIGKADVETNANTFNGAKRKDIYKNNTDQLKLLLCEVFTTLENYNVKVPAPTPLARMKLPKLKKLDLTGAYNLDLTFHTKMKKFFNRAQKIFRNNKVKGRKRKSGHKSGAVHKSKRT